MTTNIVEDILRVIRENPEAKAALRRELLTEELLQLPDRFSRFVETSNERFSALEKTVSILLIKQDEMSERQDAFAVKLDEFGTRLDKFGTRQDEFAIKLDKFDTRQDEFAIKLDEFGTRQDEFAIKLDEFGTRQDKFGTRQDRMQADLNALRGYALEEKLPSRLRQQLSPLLKIRRTRIVWLARTTGFMGGRAAQFEDELDSALDKGQISDSEYERLQVTDMVIRAISTSDDSPVYVAVEASGVINKEDIDRARISANALKKIYSAEAIPVVYGFSITDENSADARATDELDEVYVVIETE